MSRPRTSIEADFRLAIQASTNGRHLCLHSNPDVGFFWLADTAWELPHRLDKTEAEIYLRNRAAKGFNVVMIALFAEHGGLDYPNRFGEWPFEGGEKPDLSKPNPGYYEFVDFVVALAASLGIRTALVPTWGRYINGGFHRGPILFDTANAYSLGRFLGERYPYHPYILGGDSNRYWNADYRETTRRGGDVSRIDMTDYGPIFEAMARGLIDGEAMHTLSSTYKTFITFHSAQKWMPQGPVSTGSAQFPEADWLALDGCQSGHYNTDNKPATKMPANSAPGASNGQAGSASGDPKTLMHLWRGMSSYIPIRLMYNALRPDGNPRPVIDLEPHYENTHHWFTHGQPLWTAGNVRKGAWQGVISGACGYTYGCNSIWQFHNELSQTHPPIQPPTTAFTNWNVELDLAGAFHAATLKRIIESLPGYFDRIPDQSIILSDTKEPVTGYADEALICGMRERAGTWALLQLPFGGEVKVDLRKGLNGREHWRAWWWDPRIGSREVFIRDSSAPTHMFTAPTDQDWLLFIEAL